MLNRLIMISLLALLAGCTSIGIVRMSNRTYSPLAPEQVTVFETNEDVKVPFEKIAIITAQGDTDLTNKAGMINKMKKKAAELGANGLILGQFKEATTGQKVAKAFLLTSANNIHEAIAIRFKARKRPTFQEED